MGCRGEECVALAASPPASHDDLVTVREHFAEELRRRPRE